MPARRPCACIAKRALREEGIGEIAIVGVAAAVSNAIFHATGRRLRDLPMTPSKVLAALRQPA